MEANDKRLAQCQQVIGYYFSNPRLLETALTHSSLRAPDRECNERLEFLGDSILGMVITEELYHLLPDQSEGDLTRIKSAVVSRSALLTTSQRLGLARYAEFARGVGRRDKLPASVVANLVEAIIGAIYLDAGYYPAREFVLRHMGAALDDELNDRGAKNYKSLLQHEVQQSVGVTPTYRTLDAEGPDHAKEFVVAAIIRGQEWGRAGGTTKKEAEQEAARQALDAWSRRGRGRRRRRRRRGGSDAAPDAELETVGVTARDDNHAPGVESVEAAAEIDEAPTPVETEEAPRPRRRLRRRRRKGEGDDASSASPAKEAPKAPKAPKAKKAKKDDASKDEATKDDAAVVEEPVAEAAAEASIDDRPARTPRRRRRRSREAPPVETPVEAAPEPKPEPEAEAAPEPEAEKAPEPKAEPEAEPASAGFAAGILGDEPAEEPKPRVKRKRKAAKKKSAKKKADEPKAEKAKAEKPKAKKAEAKEAAGKKADAAKPKLTPEPSRADRSPSAFGAGIEAATGAKPASAKVERAKVSAPDRAEAPSSDGDDGAADGFAAGL